MTSDLTLKLDSLRPGAPPSDAPISADDVSGVLELALERVRLAVAQSHAALSDATERLTVETEAMHAAARRLTDPPPEDAL